MIYTEIGIQYILSRFIQDEYQNPPAESSGGCS